MAASITDLDRSVNSWLAWYRVRQMVNWAGRGLTLGLMVAFGFTLVARLRAVYTLDQLVQITVLASALGALWGAGVALLWPHSRMGAARYFDLAFDLGERTSTAFELAQQKINAPNWLIQQQLDDAVDAASHVEPRAALPIRVTRLELLSLLLAAALVTASLVIPNEQFAVLARQQAVKQAVAEQVEQLEVIRQQIEENNTLTEGQKEELTKPLNEAIKQLQEGDLTQEQALSTLSEAEQQLRQLADPNALAQAQALQQAGAQLSHNQQTQAFGEALQNNDLTGAAQALANMDVSNLTPAEQQQLASSLEQAAQQLQSTNPQLAQQLQQAADALRNGDTAAAQAALNSAAQTMASTASQVAQAQAASTAANQVGSGSQSVAQAGSGQQGQQGQGGQGQGQQGQGQGQGQGEGQGQGQGQGEGSGQGQGGQGGGGAGRGEGDGASQGGEAGGSPSNNNGPGDGGIREYEPIYSPYRLGGAGGPEVQLPEGGNGDPGNEIVGEGPGTVPDNGESHVPYSEVYNQYNDAAQHAIDSDEVPSTLKPVVRDYFSSLEP